MPHDIYVRVASPDTSGVERLVAPRSIYTEAGRPFCRIQSAAFDAPEEWLQSLSRDLETDVLWLATQKQVDAFAFQRWVGGTLKRRLTYGIKQERTWEEVDGLAEPWESDILFSAKQLERKLRVLSAIDPPDKAQAERLRSIWEEGRILVGENEPAVYAATAGPAVARHYGLPGWS